MFRNKDRVRPRKNARAKRQRFKVQRRRLVDLGVPEERVAVMNQDEVRALLRRPTKVLKVLGLDKD
jgi:hypothetical protein